MSILPHALECIILLLPEPGLIVLFSFSVGPNNSFKDGTWKTAWKCSIFSRLCVCQRRRFESDEKEWKWKFNSRVLAVVMVRKSAHSCLVGCHVLSLARRQTSQIPSAIHSENWSFHIDLPETFLFFLSSFYSFGLFQLRTWLVPNKHDKKRL